MPGAGDGEALIRRGLGSSVLGGGAGQGGVRRGRKTGQ